ncbi:mRNA splicing protein [Malassezia sp. CBS 17886]|nr:mRNA splicing protein [Malassezia sp. CBS 17886]
MSAAGKPSREEMRRGRDLEEARKAGKVPPVVDEQGRDINPHIPMFMAQAPWYMDTGKPSLKHQRKLEEEKNTASLSDWYARGAVAGPASTKFRKGACENCGALSHKTKDCLERPRKRGAKWSGKDIRPDEVVQDLSGKEFNYDAKRDRWNGYDPATHKEVVNKYEAIEAERRRLREEEIDNQTSTDLNAARKLAKREKRAESEHDDDFDSSSSDEDDDKYAEKANMVGQKIDADKRITVRNLRIREDRAKYLYNLSTDSAYYDPKTRSMREAPHPNEDPEDALYAGDAFERSRGDRTNMQNLQLFAWQGEARGNNMHMQANPTVNELQFREYQQNKEKLVESTKSGILDRYGGAEHLNALPAELRAGQTENYVEYSRSGQVVRGQERARVKSRYEEDVFESNHTSVWGSWYDLEKAIAMLRAASGAL